MTETENQSIFSLGYESISPTISLVIPVYNAASFIESTWSSLVGFLNSRSIPWECIYVCDGCTDGSDAWLAQALTRSEADHLAIRLVRYTPNRGKGIAVRSGFEVARGKHLIFTDVDLAYSFDAIQELADRLVAGQQVVAATRHVLPAAQHWDKADLRVRLRRVLSYAFARVVAQMLNLPLSDLQAGLKGMQAEVYKTLGSHLRCNGFAFDSEMLFYCKHFGFEVNELSASADAAHESSVNLGRALRLCLDVLNLKRRERNAILSARVSSNHEKCKSA